jgi:hypothetical protein
MTNAAAFRALPVTTCGGRDRDLLDLPSFRPSGEWQHRIARACAAARPKVARATSIRSGTMAASSIWQPIHGAHPSGASGEQERDVAHTRHGAHRVPPLSAIAFSKTAHRLRAASARPHRLRGTAGYSELRTTSTLRSA